MATFRVFFVPPYQGIQGGWTVERCASPGPPTVAAGPYRLKATASLQAAIMRWAEKQTCHGQEGRTLVDRWPKRHQ
jgi:hypothetical protein